MRYVVVALGKDNVHYHNSLVKHLDGVEPAPADLYQVAETVATTLDHVEDLEYLGSDVIERDDERVDVHRFDSHLDTQRLSDLQIFTKLQSIADAISIEIKKSVIDR